jgi:predicted transcriptional regulator
MQTNIIFRCEPSLKQQAERIAAARDERLSQVLRRALREYVRDNAQVELPRPAPARRRAAR